LISKFYRISSICSWSRRSPCRRNSEDHRWCWTGKGCLM